MVQSRISPHVSALDDRPRRVALMWRGDPNARDRPVSYEARLQPVFQALRAAGMEPEGVVWFDDIGDMVRSRLRDFDGVLVWINPLADGQDRSRVDEVLRDAATAGVWISAHPDVINKMGTKEVLYRTRHLSWGLDTDLYETPEAFAARFPAALAAGGARVLKPHRGNDGQGILKVVDDGGGRLRVQRASDDGIEMLDLAGLAVRLQPTFANGGRVVDQAFCANAAAGMVRCYMSLGHVVGFAQQSPRIDDPMSPVPPFGMKSAKTMHSPDAPLVVDCMCSESSGLRVASSLTSADTPAS